MVRVEICELFIQSAVLSDLRRHSVEELDVITVYVLNEDQAARQISEERLDCIVKQLSRQLVQSKAVHNFYDA